MKFWNRVSLVIIVLAAFANAGVGIAAGVNGSGGGNGVVAADFVYQGFLAAQALELQKAQLPDWFSISQFKTAIQYVHVYGVDQLEPVLDDQGQPKEQGIYLHARFYPLEHEIHVRWEEIKKLQSNEIRQLVLHEYLGVLFLEKDGQYDRSSQLMAVLSGATVPGNGGGVDWSDPPIVCRSDVAYEENRKAFRLSQSKYRLAENNPSDPYTESDLIWYELYTNQVQAIAARLKAGLDANASLRICQWQIDVQADVISGAHWGCKTRSPLQTAVDLEASPEMLQVLLDAGADPNPKSETPGLAFSPLGEALRNEWTEVDTIRLLIEHGAKYRDDQGRVDFDILRAMTPKDKGYPELLCNMKARVQYLQKLGADLNDPRFPSTVQLAFNNNLPMLKLYRQLGARFDLQLNMDIRAGDEDLSKYYQGMSTLHALAEIYKDHKAETAKTTNCYY